MEILTTSLSVVSGICFGVGLIFLFIGLRRRGGDLEQLTFALFALAYGGATLGAMLAYQVTSVEEYLAVDWWRGLVVGFAFIFLIWFVSVYTQVRPWYVPILLSGLFAVVVAAHVTRPYGLFSAMGDLSVVTLPWGEQLALPEAEESFWLPVFLIAQMLTIVFVFYACLQQFRRGGDQRRPALVLGGGMLFFVSTIIVDMLLETGIIDFVFTSDFGFLPLAVAMGLHLANNVVRTEEKVADYQVNLQTEVDKRTIELQASNNQLISEIAVRHRTEMDLERLTVDLQDRVKELDCLFAISDLAGQQAASLDDILQGAADLIPPALKHPERTSARIALGEREFLSAGFQETTIVQTSDLVVFGQVAGKVEVLLQANSPAGSRRSLSGQEQRLLDAVAQRLGRITERLRAQKALEQSEESYRRIVETADEGIWTLDAGFRTTYSNQRMADMLGYSVEEMINQPVTAFLFEGDVVDNEQQMEERKEGLVGRYERRFRGKDGQARWLSVSSSPVRDESGRFAGSFAMFTDISLRKQAETALRARLDELAVLNRVGKVLTSVVDLPSALGQVAEMVCLQMGAQYVHVIVGEGRGGQALMLVAGFDRALGRVESTPIETPLDRLPFVKQVLNGGESLVLPDLQSLDLSVPIRDYLSSRQAHSAILVPLLFRGATIGLMTLAVDIPGQTLADDQLRLAETVAGDVAVAVQNARLLEQEQQAAVSEERTRIARDLHDSVTQTVYSASLIAESLPFVWDKHPEQMTGNLTTLLQLTRGALAELRTLLFELRPLALREARLSSLLTQLADVLSGRTQAPVEMTVEGQGDIPLQVKIGFYRIAQEAFNNVIKHANPSRVVVTLRIKPKQVMLTIKDDGRGFGPAAAQAESMGLRIMHERADEIGASLSIGSSLDRGTELVVDWSED